MYLGHSEQPPTLDMLKLNTYDPTLHGMSRPRSPQSKLDVRIAS